MRGIILNKKTKQLLDRMHDIFDKIGIRNLKEIKMLNSIDEGFIKYCILKDIKKISNEIISDYAFINSDKFWNMLKKLQTTSFCEELTYFNSLSWKYSQEQIIPKDFNSDGRYFVFSLVKEKNIRLDFAHFDGDFFEGCSMLKNGNYVMNYSENPKENFILKKVFFKSNAFDIYDQKNNKVVRVIYNKSNNTISLEDNNTPLIVKIGEKGTFSIWCGEKEDDLIFVIYANAANSNKNIILSKLVRFIVLSDDVLDNIAMTIAFAGILLCKNENPMPDPLCYIENEGELNFI